MAVAHLAEQLVEPAAYQDLLVAQPADRLGGDDLRHRARPIGSTHLAQPGFALGEVRAGHRQLRSHLGELLLAHWRSARREQAELLAVGLHGGFSRFEAIGELAHLPVEPAGGACQGLVLRLPLRLDVKLRVAVHDPGGELGVSRLEAEGDDIGAPVIAHRQGPPIRGDRGRELLLRVGRWRREGSCQVAQRPRRRGERGAQLLRPPGERGGGSSEAGRARLEFRPIVEFQIAYHASC